MIQHVYSSCREPSKSRERYPALRRFILIITFSLTASASPVCGDSQPKIVLPATEFNFGVVAQGTKVQHTFTIRNDGTGVLILHRVQPACGCTVSIAERATLEPGSSSAVTAVFDTTGFRGQKVIPIRLYTNDPRRPVSEFTLRGVIRPDVQLTPQKVFFGTISKGSTPTMSVEVFTDGDSKIRILEASTRNSENLSIRSEDFNVGSRRGKRIHITIRENIPIGIFRALVAVKTTSEANAVVNIPVFAKVQGDLRFEPPDVSFGLIQGPLKAPLTRTVSLLNRGDKSIHISSIKADSDFLTASIERSPDSQNYLVRVTLEDGFTGALKSRIRIATDHPDPDQQQLVLPVYGIITEEGT